VSTRKNTHTRAAQETMHPPQYTIMEWHTICCHPSPDGLFSLHCVHGILGFIMPMSKSGRLVTRNDFYLLFESLYITINQHIDTCPILLQNCLSRQSGIQGHCQYLSRPRSGKYNSSKNNNNQRHVFNKN
jgi:hypothetical protein